MSETSTMDAATGTDMEIVAALRTMRAGRIGRIQKADHDIPTLYAEIKGIETRIAMFNEDREWCIKSLKTLDARLAQVENL